MVRLWRMHQLFDQMLLRNLQRKNIMGVIGCGDGPCLMKFAVKIDADADHIELPCDFYNQWKKELGHLVELKDGVKGNLIKLKLFCKRNEAVLWDAIPQLISLYGSANLHYVMFEYMGNSAFNIQVKDEKMKELVQYHNIEKVEIIQLDSNSEDDDEENEKGELRVAKEPPEESAQGIEIIQWDSDSEDDDEENEKGELSVAKEAPEESAKGINMVLDSDNEEVVTEFKKEVTRSMASSSQLLHIPVNFARQHIKHKQRWLKLYGKNGKQFKCELKWSSLWGCRSRPQYCYLGKPWYKYVTYNKVREGDVLTFKMDPEIKCVSVTISRKGKK